MGQGGGCRPLPQEGWILETWAPCLGQDSIATLGHRSTDMLNFRAFEAGRPEGSARSRIGSLLHDIPGATQFLTVSLGIRILFQEKSDFLFHTPDFVN